MINYVNEKGIKKEKKQKSVKINKNTKFWNSISAKSAHACSEGYGPFFQDKAVFIKSKLWAYGHSRKNKTLCLRYNFWGCSYCHLDKKNPNSYLCFLVESYNFLDNRCKVVKLSTVVTDLTQTSIP